MSPFIIIDLLYKFSLLSFQNYKRKSTSSRPSSSGGKNPSSTRSSRSEAGCGSSSSAKRGHPVKEALSPSVAESIRAVFAAFVWHEGIVHDTMAVASYLKFHPGLSKQGQNHGSAEAGGGAAGSDQDGAGGPTQQSKETKARQRHSVEVRHSELNRISISRKKTFIHFYFSRKKCF